MAQATTYPEESTAETITKWYLAKDSQPKKISQAEPACTGFAWLSAAKPPTSIKPDRQERKHESTTGDAQSERRKPVLPFCRDAKTPNTMNPGI